jgi:Tol biopolymer transport system component/DNA-binding winged helix-turn-helix (wHTH) protein
MPGVEQQRAFRFGAFELDSHAGELRKHGVKLKLQDQPLQILALLLSRPGELVTREEIQKQVWPEGTYVDFDNAINTAIRKLRGALGDSASTPRFIETLSRRGYRFVASVSRSAITHREVAERSQKPENQTVTVTIDEHKLTTKKRRRWWIVSATAGVFLATAITVSSWMAHSDRASSDSPLAAVPLTGNPGFEGFPTFSPEGTRVAFSWEQPGKNGPNIYVKLIGPGDPVQLTANPHGDLAPAWSPDGGHIAFLRAIDSYHAGVVIVSAAGGQERQLADICFDVNDVAGHWWFYRVPPPFLAWSADGRWLMSLEESAPLETYSIVRISVETGEKQTVTSPPMHTNGDGSLAVSPDGKTLAFTRTLGLERDIYVVSLSEDAMPFGEPRRLTFDGREIDGLSWTADGHSLVFSSTRGGRRELWRIPARSYSKAVRLTAAGDDPRNVAAARQGNRLVYSHEFLDSDVWRISLKGKSRGEAQGLISSTRLDYTAKYSPDGKRIAFESNRTGNHEIWMCNADGSKPVLLTAFRKAWAGSPRWAPDGRKIAFDCNAAGNLDIYVISAQGGKATRLTTDESNDFRPSWSRDGKWIYYCSTRTGHGQIWKVPSNGGAQSKSRDTADTWPSNRWMVSISITRKNMNCGG